MNKTNKYSYVKVPLYSPILNISTVRFQLKTYLIPQFHILN